MKDQELENKKMTSSWLKNFRDKHEDDTFEEFEEWLNK